MGIICRYPTRAALQTALELKDGVLWTKPRKSTIGRALPARNLSGPANRADGYRRIFVLGRRMLYHQALWIMSHGDVPAGMVIDHIDRERDSNSIENLRLVTPRDNATNCARTDHRPLPVGVAYDKVNKKYLAQGCLKGKNRHIGRYATVEAAKTAYETFIGRGT